MDRLEAQPPVNSSVCKALLTACFVGGRDRITEFGRREQFWSRGPRTARMVGCDRLTVSGERRDLGDRQRPVLSPKSPSKSKPSTPAGACVKLPVMVCGVAIRSAAMLVTVPAPPLTEISSPSAVLPPAKVRFPLPIVIVPPVQDPKVSPDPPDCRSRPR